MKKPDLDVETVVEEVETGDEGPPLEEESTPKRDGRPRLDGMPVGTAAPVRKLPFPRPRFKKWGTDLNKDQQMRGFCGYWKELPTWAKDRAILYVYREHPILLPPPEVDGKAEYFKYIDKISGNEPLDGEIDLLNRYGCGSYFLLFNDVESHGRERTVCVVNVSGVGGSDYRSNPPGDQRIDDVGQVDLAHPANKAYVSYLRANGKLPDPGQEEKDMAVVASVEKTVDRVLDENQKLTQQLLDMAKERREEPAKPVESQSPSGVKESIEVVADAAKKANQMVVDASVQSTKMLEAAKGAAGGGGNGITLTEVLALVTQMSKPSDNPELMEMRRQMHESNMLQIKGMQDQIKTLLEDRTAGKTPFGTVDAGVES